MNYYASERDLEDAMQREIEYQEVVIANRRERARSDALLRRKLKNDYLAKLGNPALPGSIVKGDNKKEGD